jgi:hypothetical protein
MSDSAPQLTQLARAAGCAAKISQADLRAALAHLPVAENLRVLVGHTSGDDAAVIRLTDELALVETVDVFPPIVDDPYDYGRIAAANALSDIYAMGARPLNALSFVAWPVQMSGSLRWGVCSRALRRSAKMPASPFPAAIQLWTRNQNSVCSSPARCIRNVSSAMLGCARATLWSDQAAGNRHSHNRGQARTHADGKPG